MKKTLSGKAEPYRTVRRHSRVFLTASLLLLLALKLLQHRRGI